MLSTSHTLNCPACGKQATLQIHTVRHRRVTQRDAFEPQLTFSCRNRCTLDADKLRDLGVATSEPTVCPVAHGV